jgi:hypothetical protein
MQEYLEIQKIMNAEQAEIDLLWTATENALSDQFILEATENGVSRWESMLHISPKGTDTLDERKFRILTQLNQELPYTLRKLERMLENLCGVDGYSIMVNSAEYQVEVKLALSNEGNYEEVKNVLKKMIPANMVQVITILYNPHNLFTQFTHEQLSTYTHNQLRKEVFE